MTQLGKGIYLVPQAARLVGVPARRLRRWLLGSPDHAAAVPTPPSIFDGHPSLDFADLVSALFIKAFRNHGVSLQHIRRVAEKAAQELGTEHPFTLRDFATDGRRIFRWIGDEVEARKLLVDIEREQYVMRPIFEPLLRAIDYGVSAAAQRWYPIAERHEVVVDPALAFGEPTVGGVPTRVLYGPVAAGDSPAEVARWYDLSEAEVLAACEFETKMRAQAA